MSRTVVLRTENLDVWYGNKQTLKSVTLSVYQNCITAIMGPSGCGKSTLIRCFNRMNDFVDEFRKSGNVLFFDQDIYSPEIDVSEIRVRIGMVFQKPNPFPKSIFDNVAYGPRILGMTKNSDLEERVEDSLKKAALWGEVKDDLRKNALQLSGGQQQRLCIARALAVEPEVLLMDEPTSALDPIATARIEELMESLKKELTIAIVTHNTAQASRISDYTAFLYMGDLVEFGDTAKMFTVPSDKRTEEYLTGRFG